MSTTVWLSNMTYLKSAQFSLQFLLCLTWTELEKSWASKLPGQRINRAIRLVQLCPTAFTAGDSKQGRQTSGTPQWPAAWPEKKYCSAKVKWTNLLCNWLVDMPHLHKYSFLAFHLFSLRQCSSHGIANLTLATWVELNYRNQIEYWNRQIESFDQLLAPWPRRHMAK